MKKITVLIPTYNRLIPLIATLTSLTSQTFKNFDIVIADQSEKVNVSQNPTIQTLIRLFKTQNINLQIFKNLPPQGISQQRQSLLDKSSSPFSLFLDDDLILEPDLIKRLHKTINKEKCAFVGSAPIGLSFLNDQRLKEQKIEFWENGVKKEKLIPYGRKWDRYLLHNAANLYHVQQKLKVRHKLYRIAWVGACVLYNTVKLKNIGGFKFYKKLGKNHVGEDVYIQLKLMEKFGGCGLFPSGVYHQEVPTTIKNRKINAVKLLIKV